MLGSDLLPDDILYFTIAKRTSAIALKKKVWFAMKTSLLVRCGVSSIADREDTEDKMEDACKEMETIDKHCTAKRERAYRKHCAVAEDNSTNSTHTHADAYARTDVEITHCFRQP